MRTPAARAIRNTFLKPTRCRSDDSGGWTHAVINQRIYSPPPLPFGHVVLHENNALENKNHKAPRTYTRINCFRVGFKQHRRGKRRPGIAPGFCGVWAHRRDYATPLYSNYKINTFHKQCWFLVAPPGGGGGAGHTAAARGGGGLGGGAAPAGARRAAPLYDTCKINTCCKRH